MKNISRLIEVLVKLQKHYNEITPNYCEHVHTCTVSVRILFCLLVFFLGGGGIKYIAVILNTLQNQYLY